ncbi:MAG: nucleotide-binding protein [Parvibaculum sp.]|nr:nucleotide-binding protein [Parvibaculum sp.]
MKERFEGDNMASLVRALKVQPLVMQDAVLAESLAKAGSLVEFGVGDTIITQDAPDNDIYFLIVGTVAIIVNGANVAVRKAGQTVGEMAAIEPSLPRSATARAMEPVVALKIATEPFFEIAEAHPKLFLPLAQDLSKRLFQRNETIAQPNRSPKLFIISSSEAKEIAHALRAGMEHHVFSTVWDEGVFWAGGYPLEALEKQVAESDFAVAIAEPDDVLESRGSRAPTLRDNVLFELGLFMGKLSRHRSILVHPKIANLKLPSDLQGLTLISYSAGPEPLGERLDPVCQQVKAVVERLGVRVFEKS